MRREFVLPSPKSSFPRKGIVLFALACLIGGGVALMGNWDRMDLGAFWFIFPVLIGTALLGLGAVFLHLRAQKHQWISYQLVIDKKGITRHQLKRPSIHIQKEAMRDVLVHENGTLEIRSRYTDGSPIYIPPALLGFDEVRKLLTAEWSVPMYPVNEAP